MPNLYDILADAQQGEAMATLGREFGLTSEQTQAAVAALLPAISLGIKRVTATPEGLGNLFALMGRQPDLYAMYADPQAAFSRQGQAAGNEILSAMFGSPDASRAITGQAQQLSGVTSAILKKLLPVLAGLVISGLMRAGSGQAAPSAPQPAPEQGGGLGDILREIFKQGGSGSSAPAPSPAPPAPRNVPPQDGGLRDKLGPRPGYRIPASDDQASPAPTDTGEEPMPGGDVLGQIMRELGKAIQDGRLKPVVIGPVEIDVPGQVAPSGSGQQPGGDILGQILREVLGGGEQLQVPRQGQSASLKGGAGAAVFGDQLDAGPNVDQSHLDSLQELFDRFLGAQRR
jgi:hypothetical protein